jgi:hypothetical protein
MTRAEAMHIVDPDIFICLLIFMTNKIHEN